MVMDATPSPQSVGREFVRQYYTLLNKAPHHLHRFYNHQSSFVHGGLEPAQAANDTTTTTTAAVRDCGLVIGQKQIHNKIQQLNFRDCHAKISQVDAQATLGNGVVVQVTGELSNDGQPMRRFTQTFVLAAQAPKKYYVHNDIFRYQDVVWDEQDQQQQQVDGHEQDSDARSEEVCSDDVSGPTGDIGQQQQVVDMQQQHQVQVQGHHQAMQQQQQVPIIAQEAVLVHQQQQQVPLGQQAGQPMYYNAGGVVKPAPGMFPNPPSVPLNGHPQQQQQHPQQVIPVAAPVQPNNEVHQQQQQRIPAQQAPAPVVVQQQQPSVQFSEPAVAIVAEKPVTVVVDDQQLVKEKEKPAPAPVVIEEAAVIVEKKPPQPETFASLVKSGGGGGVGRVMASRGPGAAPVVIQPVSVVSPAGNVMGNNHSNHSNNQGENNNSNRPMTNNTQNNHHSGSNHNTNNSSGGGNVRERRSSTNNNSGGGGGQGQYGDSQQLFVGNIPHHATEEELKAMFSKYGAVLDLRIFAKQSNVMAGGPKGGPGGRVPQNYGFVTFKESESAQAVLANSVRGR